MKLKRVPFNKILNVLKVQNTKTWSTSCIRDKAIFSLNCDF